MSKLALFFVLDAVACDLFGTALLPVVFRRSCYNPIRHSPLFAGQDRTAVGKDEADRLQVPAFW